MSKGFWERKFLAAIKLVSRIRVITHVRARLGSVGRASPPRAEGSVAASPPAAGQPRAIVALGASTGGPGALVDVLREIPIGSPAALLVVLHIDEMFSAAFADWLAAQTAHPVVYAHGGEPLASARGRVFMAPPGRHLVVRAGKLWLSSEPERHSCRPSVDVLFESLALECPRDVIACLLTGMGRDGAEGATRAAPRRGTHHRSGRGELRDLRHAARGRFARRGRAHSAARRNWCGSLGHDPERDRLACSPSC